MRRAPVRVVVTGSECTGKTTLAAALADHYHVEFVPEFVRGFAERRGGVIEAADHDPIALGQIASEDEYAARALALLIQDTDLLSTVIYCRHYAGRCPAWIEEATIERRPDLYLLCAPDIPWIADGVRDRGDRREEMHALFSAATNASGVPVVELAGDRTERLRRSVQAIDALLAVRSSR